VALQRSKERRGKTVIRNALALQHIAPEYHCVTSIVTAAAALLEGRAPALD
jgi:hypothetical protein